MSCELLTGGISKPCDTNKGGIQKMWITEKSNVSSLSLSSPGGEIDTITMVGGADFYEFEFNKNTSSYQETYTADVAAGTEFYAQVVTLVLNRREKTKRDTLMLLSHFKDLYIIVKDGNGINYLFGEVNGMNLTGNDGGSGVASTDPNRYTLTFTGEEPELANTVTDAAIAAVI